LNKVISNYIFSREINGGIIPHRVQNIIIREYCDERDIPFSLSATELNFEKSYNVLFNLLNTCDEIIFYSFFMFPEDESIRNEIYELIKKNDLKIHFCAEEIMISKDNLGEFEKVLQLKKIANNDISKKVYSIYNT